MISIFLCNEKSNKIFLSFFIIYLLLGLCISYQEPFTHNLFFGGDNARAYGDLAEIFANHYRIKVHPLFLLMTQPLVLMVNGLVNNTRLAVIIIEAIFGALYLKYFYKILEELLIKFHIKLSITLILGGSFSFIIYSTTPETFIFSGFWLCFFVYKLIIISKFQNFSLKSAFDIAFLGVLCTGGTITNCIVFLIGLFFVTFNSNLKKQDKYKFIIKSILFSGLILLLLLILQKLIWNDCPIFISSLLGGILGFGYEETLYMQFDFDIYSFKEYLKQFFTIPVISPTVQLNYINDINLNIINFSAYLSFIKYFLYFYIGLIFILIIFNLINIFKNKNFYRVDILLLTILIFIFNFLLHFCYGRSEAFIYSCHYIFLLMIVLSMFANNLSNYFNEKYLCIILYLFFAIELTNNLFSFKETILLGYECIKHEYNLYITANVIFYSIVCLLFIYIISIIYKKVLKVNNGKSNSIILVSYIFICLFVIELFSILNIAGGFKGFINSVITEFSFIL